MEKRYSLVKPTFHTPFHIDFEWWRKNDRDWRVHLRSCLCQEHQRAFSDLDIDDQVDWIDPETAEVQLVDGLQNILITHCSKTGLFITNQTTLVESVFRIFLANGNLPLTTQELADRLSRPSTTILRTLSGMRVYNGLRPCLES